MSEHDYWHPFEPPTFEEEEMQNSGYHAYAESCIQIQEQEYKQLLTTLGEALDIIHEYLPNDQLEQVSGFLDQARMLVEVKK